MPLLPRDLPVRLAADGYVGPGAEADAPGLQMRVLSARRAQVYRPGPDEVCISIRARGESPTPLLEGWRDVLRVECDDTGAYAAPRPEARSLTPAEAKAILEFAARHRARRRLVIHCGAGVSRSRSIAAALAEVLGLPYRWTVVNPEVVAAIRAAAVDVRASS